MLRKLVVPLFVVAVAAYGCGEDKKNNGTGGTGGTPADAGPEVRAEVGGNEVSDNEVSEVETGGGTDVAPAACADDGTNDSAATTCAMALAGAAGRICYANAPGEPSACVNPMMTLSTTNSQQPGQRAVCPVYETVCGFDPANADRYADCAACAAAWPTYNANVTTGLADRRGCAAYHLCLAKEAKAAGNEADRALHCSHVNGGGGDPCGLKAVPPDAGSDDATVP